MATTYRDNGRTLFSGTEAERLAYTIETSDTYEKNVFWIEPNGNEFRVIEGAWVKIKAAGASLTSAVSSTGVAQGTVVAVLDAQTGDFTGAAVPFGVKSGIVHATIDTTGAKTCTISLYGSINADKSDPQLLFTFTMATTATGTDTDFDFITAEWPYVYGVISATAGAGTLDSADLDIAV